MFVNATRLATAAGGTIQLWEIGSAEPTSDPVSDQPSMAAVCAIATDGVEVAVGTEDGGLMVDTTYVVSTINPPSSVPTATSTPSVAIAHTAAIEG